ncbi:MAG: hypothetical protein JNL74_07135 [Fibrobacteres bacterium]|nr:hypothetical protein [Fibrobacterota bacterium]
MYITNHLVESSNDKIEIYSNVHFKKSEYDPKENELFFCVMDEQEVIGCAVVSHLSGISSSLDEIVLLDKYNDQKLEISLLNYIAYELLAIGKRYLVINNLKKLYSAPSHSWVKDLINTDSLGNLLIKLDGLKEVDDTRKIG